MSYAEEFDSELDSDPDDAKKKSKANMAVALMDSTEDLDDEVERVLGHRRVISPSFCVLAPRCIVSLTEQLEAVLLFCFHVLKPVPMWHHSLAFN